MRVQTVLLDLGGVLFYDSWETMLLTPKLGLADQLGMPHEILAQVGRDMWPQYCVGPTVEADYWRDLSVKLGVPLTQTILRKLDMLLVPNPSAELLLTAAAAAGTRSVGIVSDNTSFWYEKQCEALQLSSHVDDRLVFLSFRYGVQKDALPGLFDVAASYVDPATTMIVEDRPRTLERASRLGFVTVQYNMSDEDALTSLLARLSQ